MADRRIYGIDLGTTYSCIAYVDEHGKAVVVPNSEGQLTTPSVVYFEEEDNIVVGAAAKDMAEIEPEKVISTVKRQMGKEWVTEQYGTQYSAQEISAYILRKVVADAEQKTGHEIKDVVITCPAYFGAVEKKATRDAGEIAGLNVHYVIPEPTAAAFAHSMDSDQARTILVYDLGGGTFDVTVLRITDNDIQVVCTGGDHELGGKDWDETIAAWLAQRLSDETGVDADDVIADRETWAELLRSAEDAKIMLSSKNKHRVKVRYDIDQAVITLTRDEFDELTGSLLEQTLLLTDELLETARKEHNREPDRILLVGGSTFMPQVKAAVEAKYATDGVEVGFFDPNEAVAKGAALMGRKCELDEKFREIVKQQIASETGKSSDEIEDAEIDEKMEGDEALRNRAEEQLAEETGMALPGVQKMTRKTIRNVTSQSFGAVVLRRGREGLWVDNLIVVDDEVPLSVSREYVTAEDNQMNVEVGCVETATREKFLPYDEYEEQRIGQVEVNFDSPMPRGTSVEVRFSLADDGLLSVHAKIPATGQEGDAVFQSDAILSIKEIERKKDRSKNIAVS